MSIKEIISIAGMETLRIVGNGASLVLAVSAMYDFSRGDIGSYITGISKGFISAFMAYNLNFTEKYNYKIKSRKKLLRSLKKFHDILDRGAEELGEVTEELHGAVKAFGEANARMGRKIDKLVSNRARRDLEDFLFSGVNYYGGKKKKERFGDIGDLMPYFVNKKV